MMPSPIARSPLLLTLFTTILTAQGWTPGPSMVTARAGCAVAVDSLGRIWATGGRLSWTPGPTGTATGTVEYCDTTVASPAWIQINQQMITPREFHAAVCVGCGRSRSAEPRKQLVVTLRRCVDGLSCRSSATMPTRWIWFS